MEEFLFTPSTLERLKLSLKNICNFCCQIECKCTKTKNYGGKWTLEQVNLLVDCIESGNFEKMGRTEGSLKCQIGKMCMELNQESRAILASLFK